MPDQKVESYDGWIPRRGVDGKVVIEANCSDDNGRFPTTGLSPDRYIERWDANALKFRAQGREKPEHLPTPTQVKMLIAAEKAGRNGDGQPAPESVTNGGACQRP